jgi:hypothetical protein
LINNAGDLQTITGLIPRAIMCSWFIGLSQFVQADYLRPLQKAPFCAISVSNLNFNPRNTQCIPLVKIFSFLELEQKRTFFKGLYLSGGN